MTKTKKTILVTIIGFIVGGILTSTYFYSFFRKVKNMLISDFDNWEEEDLID